MNAKGTAVKVTKDYVKEHYPSYYDNWIKSLPQESRKILENPILSGEWYPIYESFIIPTRKIADLFFHGSAEEAAYEIGRFSAKVALKGIYKIFLRIASMQFVIKRAPAIYNTYYDKGNFKIIKTDSNSADIELSDIDIKYDIFFNRIAGWMSGVPEMVGNRLVDLKFSKKVIDDTQIIAKFKIVWE